MIATTTHDAFIALKGKYAARAAAAAREADDARPLNCFYLDGDRIGCRLSGRQIVRLMRKHGVTIRDLSQRMGITQKRIRAIRTDGLDGMAAMDWQEGIQGGLTPRQRAQWRVYRRQWVADNGWDA